MLQRTSGKYCLIHLFAQVFIVVSAIKMRYCTSLHFNAYTVVQLWVIHPEISYDIESSEKLFNLRVRLIFSEHPGVHVWTHRMSRNFGLMRCFNTNLYSPGKDDWDFIVLYESSRTSKIYGTSYKNVFFFLNTTIPELECGESCSFWSFVLYQASAR